MQERQVTIGETYALGDEEREEVKRFARERTSANRAAGVGDAGIGPGPGLHKDMIGVAGEWAFARLAMAEFDASVSPRSYLRGEDDSGDFTYSGVALDIKSTKYVTGRLVVAPWKGDSRFVYGLMVMVSKDGPIFQFKGFAPPSLVIQHEDDLGHGRTFAVPQEKLQEWWQVDELLIRCEAHGIKCCLSCPGLVL